MKARLGGIEFEKAGRHAADIEDEDLDRRLGDQPDQGHVAE